MILKKFHTQLFAHVFSQSRTWCSLARSTPCSYFYQNIICPSTRCRHLKKSVILPRSFMLCEQLVLLHTAAVLSTKEKQFLTLQSESEVKDDLIPVSIHQIPRKNDITFQILKLLQEKEIFIEDENQWYISMSRFSDFSVLQELEAILLKDEPSLISSFDSMILRYAAFLDKGQMENLWFQHVRRQNRFDSKLIMWYLQQWVEKDCSSYQEKELFEICEELKKQYTVMPSILLSKVILAYAKTSQWEKCIDMLKDLKKISEITKTQIDSKILLTMVDLYIRKGSLNNVQELVMMHQDRFGEKVIRSQDEIYKLLVSCCQKYGASKFPGEKVLEYQSRHWWFPRKKEVFNLINCLKERTSEEFTGNKEWITRAAKLDKYNKCSNCGTQLKSVELTTTEFHDLQKVVLESFVKRNDIYYNSTPKEYNAFLRLIEMNDPFDFIVDGLNVFFYRGAISGKSIHGIKDVIMQLSQGNRRILVIARKHIQSIAEKTIPKPVLYGKNVQFFYCDQLTNDDSFIIHAAFKSGPNAMIVTNDNLRNHMSYMENFQMNDCFERWRLLHQIKFTKSGLQKPVLPKPNAQKDENGWHIPFRYTDENLDHLGNLYSRSLRYLHDGGYICLRKV